MIDLNDLQKPATAVLVVGAAAAAGFIAGYMIGRDPELARRMARSVAGGLTRLQVAAAEAWENIGDLWADARAEARRDIEAERFAAGNAAHEASQTAPVTATAAAVIAKPGAGAKSSRRRKARTTGKKVRRVAKAARGSAAPRGQRRRATTAVAT